MVEHYPSATNDTAFKMALKNGVDKHFVKVKASYKLTAEAKKVKGKKKAKAKADAPAKPAAAAPTKSKPKKVRRRGGAGTAQRPPGLMVGLHTPLPLLPEVAHEEDRQARSKEVQVSGAFGPCRRGPRTSRESEADDTRPPSPTPAPRRVASTQAKKTKPKKAIAKKASPKKK